jgi:hypothetical protein
MMFPDVLSKFIEVQMTFINERVKNLRNLSAFLGDMYNCYDVLQKSIGKIVKAGATYMQVPFVSYKGPVVELGHRF